MSDLRDFDSHHIRTFVARETYVPCTDGPYYSPVFNSKYRIVNLIAGDELKFIKNADNNTGCIVRNVRSCEQGFVSNEFLVDSAGSFTEPWYYGPIERQGAERFLLAEYNIEGAFLVRESRTDPGNFVLCYKCFDDESQRYRARQAKIYVHGRKFRVGRTEFNSIQELIKMYQKTPLPFKPKIALTNCCLLVRSQHPGLKGLMDPWKASEEEIEPAPDAADAVVVSTDSGIIYRGRWRGLVAADVKVVCRLGSRAMGGIAGTASTAAREAKLIEREFETMKGLAHPNVVQVFCFSTSPAARQMVMECCSLGPIGKFLREEGKSQFSTNELLSCAKDILLALRYLSIKQIFHCDVGGHSVFLSHLYKAKLGGFTYARTEDEELTKAADADQDGWGVNRLHSAHFHHAAPEVIGPAPTYSAASDMWSFGIFLWELCSHGAEPFLGLGRDRLLRELIDPGVRPPRPPDYADMGPNIMEELFDAINSCWTLDPAERKTSAELATRVDEIARLHDGQDGQNYSA